MLSVPANSVYSSDLHADTAALAANSTTAINRNHVDDWMLQASMAFMSLARSCPNGCRLSNRSYKDDELAQLTCICLYTFNAARLTSGAIRCALAFLNVRSSVLWLQRFVFLAFAPLATAQDAHRSNVVRTAAVARQ